ncbi:hypothetical protein [Synechococcus sp. CCY9201]|uniref:hypothetical protein n=1 Tax=Synechococcus sp. CCY9201 TaxID=174697 RepID=UPI002B21D6FB|nr:hypothetical protein [Synechococcus sp. CCY9201]
MVSFSSGTLLGARKQGQRTDAQATADAGVDRVMAAFNSVENRRILVSGEAMGNWGSADLVSPCRDSSNNPPGNPTTEAKNYGDGKFRDLETLAVGSGTRQFRVVEITQAAGLADNPNRRSESITTTAGSTKVSKVGNFSSDLINLDPPTDSKSSNLPGFNKGYFTITVEAKVVNGSSVSTATVTREYEVLPKCCGASFGSNGSGGAQVSGSDSLGGDSRFCGVEFGMILGLNGGTAWQNFANDIYTKRLPSGKVVPITNVIGIVSKDGDKFSRAAIRVRPNSKSTTVPDPCDPARWSGGRCGSSSWTGLAKASPGGIYGTQADIDGTALSGIPIFPSALTLPTIGNEAVTGKYNFTWTKNSGPAQRVDPSIDDGQRYPTLNPASVQDYGFRFRTRNNVNPPVLEVCNDTNTNCGNSSWTAITGNSGTVNNRENFNSMSGTYITNNCTSSSSPACPTWVGDRWYGVDNNSPDTNMTSGRLRLSSGSIRIGATSSTTNNRLNGICRAANLSGNLGRAMLSFDQAGTSKVDTADQVWVQVQTSSGTSCTGSTASSPPTKSAVNISWVTVAKFPGVNSSTSQRRVVSLADYENSNTRIRIINGTNTGNGETHIIDNVNLSLSDWCEYSANSPASAAPGFHCLGPQFNLDPGSGNGGQVWIDASGGPVSFYYTRTDDLRGNLYTAASASEPSTYDDPLLSAGRGAFLRLVKCSGSPSNNCETPIPSTEVALVGDPDNLNFFGRDSGQQQVIYYGVLNTSSGIGKVSGIWFYMPVGYFELKAYGCSGYSPGGTAPSITGDDGWILSGRIWTQHFKPCGDVHIRVPPSSASNLGQVAAASGSFSDSITYVPWTGTDWVARTITRSRYN